MKDILGNGNLLFYIISILIVAIAGAILLMISKLSGKGLVKYWGKLDLLQHEQFLFFIAKTSAYRRILYFFTFISYGVRILGTLTTFFIVYCMFDNNNEISKGLLVFAALCDGINLLFPFQRYVDLFSECCIKMEKGILHNNTKLMNKDQNIGLDTLCEIYSNLSAIYIECEDLIHTQNKI